jgi:glutathione S-transferase
MRVFDYLDSGNGYKVRLLLAQLGQSYEWTELDIDKGETRTPEFLARFPNGRIPAVQLDNGVNLFESNAIIWYLAEGSKLAPADRRARAETLQWMFFEQYSHEPYIATVRFWKHFLPKLTPLQEMELPGRMEKGYAALGVMEQHLGRNQFFVGGQYGLADITLYAYTHVAGEGGFNLDNFPQVNAWMARVAAQAGDVSIDHHNN